MRTRLAACTLFLIFTHRALVPIAGAQEEAPVSPPATPVRTGPTPRPDAERRVPIGSSAVRGPRDAPVTVTMFGSYHCMFTQHVAGVELPKLLQAYPNDVNYVMKQFPLPREQDATATALGLLAAHKQGRFWEMYDITFTGAIFMESLPGPRLLAQRVNLDLDQWEHDRTSSELRAALQADVALGQRLGVKGTPTVFVNDLVQPRNDFDHLKIAVQQQLDGTASPLPPLPTPPPTVTPLPHVSPAPLDARTLSLGEPLKLDERGYKPVFSPQGDRILYVKSASNGAQIAIGGGGGSDHSLWVVNVSGGDAHYLIEGAYAGSWSPDATKIAFLREGGGLGLFDLASQKTFDLLQNESNYELYGWSPDGGSIVVGFADHTEHRYRNIALNLDDLKRTDITTGKEDRAVVFQKLRRAFQNDPLTDMFYGNHCYWDVIGHAPPRHVAGVWARDLKGSFAQLLHDAPLGTLALSPDHSRIAFGTVNPDSPGVSTGLYVATVGANESASPRTFQLALDQAFLAKAFGPNAKRCLAAGPLMASVYSPKRNPLNDKVVGAGDIWRGNVHLSLPDKAGQATADVAVERASFGTDSVLHELWVGPYDKPPQIDACVVTLSPDTVVELHAP